MFNRKEDEDVAAVDGPSDYGDNYGDNYDYNRHDGPTDDSSVDPDSGVKRGLKNRHLSMMALAGIIGPGLLVGAGGALNKGGPASLIIGFGVIGRIPLS